MYKESSNSLSYSFPSLQDFRSALRFHFPSMGLAILLVWAFQLCSLPPSKWHGSVSSELPFLQRASTHLHTWNKQPLQWGCPHNQAYCHQPLDSKLTRFLLVQYYDSLRGKINQAQSEAWEIVHILDEFWCQFWFLSWGFQDFTEMHQPSKCHLLSKAFSRRCFTKVSEVQL